MRPAVRTFYGEVVTVYAAAVLSVVFLLFAVYSVFCFFKAYRMVFGLSHPKKFETKISSRTPVAYKKFTFENRDGLKLKGMEIAPKYRTDSIILVCHYLGGSKEQVFPFVDFLVDAGFKVISFDFRCHGESQFDKRVKFSLNQDFEAFLEYVEHNYAGARLGVMGFSMGSTPALCGLALHESIRAAVIDSGPLLYSKKYFQYVLRFKHENNPVIGFWFILIFMHYAGFKRMSMQTCALLRSIKDRPVFFIHGEKDNIIPLENAREAIGQLENTRAELWKVPRSRHLTNRFLKRDEYEERVVNFFKKNVCEG